MIFKNKTFIPLFISLLLLVSCQYQTTQLQKEVEYISTGILIINNVQNGYAVFQFYYDNVPILKTNVINASKTEFYTQSFIKKQGNLRVEAKYWTTKEDHSSTSKSIPLTWKIPPSEHPNFPLNPSIYVEFNGTDLTVEERFIPTV